MSNRLTSCKVGWPFATALMLAVGIALADPSYQPKQGDWPMWGGSTDRNMVSDETGIPAEWDAESKKNIKWTAPLGSQSYGNPVIVNGKIFVGTNNNGGHRLQITGDKGVILCVEEKTGRMLWQATHDKLPSGRINDWPEQGICSAPWVDGDRLYYVSNRCQLVCADVNGFLDDENDGPFKSEKYHEKQDADFIWVYDMIGELGVFPHNLATSSPVGAGDLVFTLTSNGVDDGHTKVPAPKAPDIIAVNKNTGKLAWAKTYSGADTLHGQWSSPAYGVIDGRPQVVFGGGNGWCYGLEPKTGELIWKFDLNPKESEYKLGGRGTRNSIIATPVIYDNKVFLSVGDDPEYGEGPGHLYAIDATGKGDITGSGRVWHFGDEDFNRSLSTVAIADGLLYVSDLSGFLYCLDVRTGKRHWRHDTFAAVWGSPYVVDGKVMLGTEDGEMVVLKHAPKLEVLAANDLGNSIYTTPVAANGVLYVVNRRTLFAIQEN